ncbi:MAG: LD-carboxypeptidase [Clostridia bacterium]|nr:LD-carboxypeptidase [Clostridia bacterium]
MIYPKFLEKGDCIGVPAPSGGAYDELHINKYKNSKLKLEKMGYKCVLSENINKSEMARSAPAKVRAEEINRMFEDENIDFIMCAAGGEFLVEILPYVDFEKILAKPKFVQGFSDPTGILFPLTTKYDIATIYGNNFGEYGVQEYDRSVKENLQILQGNLVIQDSYEMYESQRAEIENPTGLEGYNFTDKVEWKIVGDSSETKFEGRIIGGCLDIIAETAGTKYDGTSQFIEKYKNDGIIWYFDNCELSLEELIRTLWKLNEFEYFKYTKGIVFGRNGVENSLLGYTMEQAIKDSVIVNLNIPIIYDADISHKGPCMTIINGAIATVESRDGKGSICFELK